MVCLSYLYFNFLKTISGLCSHFIPSENTIKPNFFSGFRRLKMEMLARNGLTLFFPMMFPFDSPECF